MTDQRHVYRQLMTLRYIRSCRNTTFTHPNPNPIFDDSRASQLGEYIDHYGLLLYRWQRSSVLRISVRLLQRYSNGGRCECLRYHVFDVSGAGLYSTLRV
jgi:hypothetical protein